MVTSIPQQATPAQVQLLTASVPEQLRPKFLFYLIFIPLLLLLVLILLLLLLTPNLFLRLAAPGGPDVNLSNFDTASPNASVSAGSTVIGLTVNSNAASAPLVGDATPRGRVLFWVLLIIFGILTIAFFFVFLFGARFLLETQAERDKKKVIQMNSIPGFTLVPTSHS